MPRLATIFCLVCVLFSAPLCANSVTFAKPHEARAAMGVIRDRLREKYKNNSNRIDARWTLDDVVSADEISGSFLSASAYELSFPADQPITALLAGFVVGIMLAAASAPVPTAAFSATGFGALVAVSSFVRYKMS